MYNCNSEDYRTLYKVCIGTHELYPTECQCVDCESFKLKN